MMAPMAPSGSGGEGNTKLSPSTKTVRQNAAKRWLFVWNNYPENWLALLAPALEDTLWIGGYEVGEQGTPHIQGYVEFPKKVRPIGYKGAPKEIHWGDKYGKCCTGTRIENIEYCSKDENVEPKSTLKPERKLKFPVFDKWWQTELLEIIKQEPDDRSIYWYWSQEGKMGKTTFAKYLCAMKGACLLAGKGADVRNGALTYKKDMGKYPDLCVFVVPRSYNAEYLSYEAMENVKDALFYSGKYEGGTVCDPCPHLFVFANFPPDREKMSGDRWIVKNIDENV